MYKWWIEDDVLPSTRFVRQLRAASLLLSQLGGVLLPIGIIGAWLYVVQPGRILPEFIRPAWEGAPGLTSTLPPPERSLLVVCVILGIFGIAAGTVVGVLWLNRYLTIRAQSGFESTDAFVWLRESTRVAQFLQSSLGLKGTALQLAPAVSRILLAVRAGNVAGAMDAARSIRGAPYNSDDIIETILKGLDAHGRWIGVSQESDAAVVERLMIGASDSLLRTHPALRRVGGDIFEPEVRAAIFVVEGPSEAAEAFSRALRDRLPEGAHTLPRGRSRDNTAVVVQSPGPLSVVDWERAAKMATLYTGVPVNEAQYFAGPDWDYLPPGSHGAPDDGYPES
jgi:hypothetical protein